MTPPAAGERPYRAGVGCLVLDRAGRVLVARRIGAADHAWQMPQGGIDDGESPRQAALREFAEEIGTDKAEIIAESTAWRSYDLPTDIAARVLGGRYRGQRLKWFALRFTGTDSDIDLAADDNPEFSDWKWVAIDDVPRLIIPFKRALYEAVVAEFRHLATPQAWAGA